MKNLRFHLATPSPTSSGAAIAIIHISADSPAALDTGLQRLGIAPIAACEIALRNLLSIDRGIMARPDACSLQFMPHGGRAVVNQLMTALEAAGLARTDPADIDPLTLYPEAGDLHEARMLAALARAASPLAVDILLAQPPLCREAAHSGAGHDSELSRLLRRLINPPLVAAVGPANVGKSTLLNALAGRSIAAVADIPGTTRDHLGATLILDGLAIRWIDTPGRRTNPNTIEREAMAIAQQAISHADLIVLCADAQSGFLPSAETTGASGLSLPPAIPLLYCATRADRGKPPSADITTAAALGQGIDALAQAVRRKLVPDAQLQRAAREGWKFW